ncbi:protein HEG isoform X2 [Denticeps clupeoides]|uniref:EGF-like domain-containing protein n=1 Tax=Denticeps clupeoides TaxID=299321 RepID=A0AAY4E1A3_9TELE|nr:protein HEG homolog 1 isoform X2 [Denticeps clupeoides]
MEPRVFLALLAALAAGADAAGRVPPPPRQSGAVYPAGTSTEFAATDPGSAAAQTHHTPTESEVRGLHTITGRTRARPTNQMPEQETHLNVRLDAGAATELTSAGTPVSIDFVSEWERPAATRVADPRPGTSQERQAFTEARTIRETPVALVTEPSTNVRHLATQRDVSYISSTVSRAGERSLLSVTINSTYSYTGDSGSESFTSDAGSVATKGGGSSDNATASGFDQTVVTSHSNSRTNSSVSASTDTEGPRLSTWTHSRTGQPNVTQGRDPTSSHDSTHDSTPSVTEASNDPGDRDVTHSSHAFTEIHFVPSVSPLMSSEDTPTFNTEASSRPSTGTVRLPTHEQTDVDHGVTTVSPTIRSSITHVDDSFSSVSATENRTDQTEVQSTVVTQRQTEKDPHHVTATPPPPSTNLPTSTPVPATSHHPQTSTGVEQQTVIVTIDATHRSTQGTPSISHRFPSTRTGQTSSSTGTDVTTFHQEPSGELPRKTQHPSTTPSYSKSSSTKSSSTQTPSIQTQGSSTTLAATPQGHVRSTPTPGLPCGPRSCANGGQCVMQAVGGYKCVCLPAWTGPSCTEDVNECKSSPCPAGSACVNTRGSFSCECPIGMDLEDGRTCSLVKTFLGTFTINNSHSDLLHPLNSGHHEVHRELIHLLNTTLSILRDYRRSTLGKWEGLHVRAVNMFSISTNVTSADVYNSIQMSLRNCSQLSSHCRVVLEHRLSYRVESLCNVQTNQCDQTRSVCTDFSGTQYCKCQPGYYKHSSDDQTCLDCGDGYKLENGTCVRCTFGFGGFNCKNFYELIALVVSPVGGGLLLILLIALIVTCCRKDKNDISKIIFKSGDFQMSPYADFPKNNRVSMEWGRETIEMQENGSTKNLLQMSDIYYSPALRNSDLERNGLYPFSGLPGSRHSCIYPAQWNLSFISDDSRRRDYF